MSALSDLLKEGRHAKGWTLRKAAEETGVSNGYLSLMETGRIKSPSPSTLNQLAEKYNLSYASLLELAGHPLSGPIPVAVLHGAEAAPRSSVRAKRARATTGRGTAEDKDAAPSARGAGRTTTARLSARQPVIAITDELQELSDEDLGRVHAFISGLRAARR